MIWQIEWDDRARKELRTLDKTAQQKILTYLRERACHNPRDFGKNLSGSLSGLWRYRVGDYRIICKLEDHCVRVFVLAVNHRREVYG